MTFSETLFQFLSLATLATLPGVWALAAALPILPQLLLFAAAGIVQAKHSPELEL